MTKISEIVADGITDIHSPGTLPVLLRGAWTAGQETRQEVLIVYTGGEFLSDAPFFGLSLWSASW